MPSQAARNREKTSAALKTKTAVTKGYAGPLPSRKPTARPAPTVQRPDRRDRRNRIKLRPGDTLNTLSTEFGASPEDIVRANTGVITYRPGIHVTIPGPPRRTPKPGIGGLEPGGYLPSRVPTPTPPAAQPDAWRTGYESELIYQRQLVKTESNIRQYNQFPDYMTDRTMTSLGLAAVDMQDLGYVRDGNYWVATEAVGGLPEPPAPSGGGGGAGGAGGGGGGRRGGGGGGRGGTSGTYSQPQQHFAEQSGTLAYSTTGRMFSPDILGLIHWRL